LAIEGGYLTLGSPRPALEVVEVSTNLQQEFDDLVVVSFSHSQISLGLKVWAWSYSISVTAASG
jgi:hypothetical protein